MYKLQVNNEQMEVVKLIYNKYLELRSLSKLYKYIYNNGIRVLVVVNLTLVLYLEYLEIQHM